MLEAFQLSDTGCIRTNNEDYCRIAPELGLYVLADEEDVLRAAPREPAGRKGSSDNNDRPAHGTRGDFTAHRHLP